jgi:hypothetical protein
MGNKIHSLTLSRVQGNTKRIDANIKLEDGNKFVVEMPLVGGDVYINPMKVFRAYKKSFPHTRTTMKNRLFKSVVRGVVCAWKERFGRKKDPSIRF